MRESPCCCRVSCLSLSYLLWLSLALLCSSFPRRCRAPLSHLRIGLPFGTPIPCLQLEQVIIRLGTFSPTLRVVSFTISFDEWTTKLFLLFKLFYLSSFCFCRSIFFLFHCVTLHSHRISISYAIRNSLSVSAAAAGRKVGDDVS